MKSEEVIKRIENGELPLEISIMKWERIKKGEGAYNAFHCDTCALCVLHHKYYDCPTCPIAKKTGKGVCRGTPYNTISKMCSGISEVFADKVAAQEPVIMRLIDEEIEFLKSLRE